MTSLDWVAAAVIVGGVVFLRRQIVALGRRAAAAARKRPALWSVPLVLLGLLVAWKGPEWQLASRQALLTPEQYLELQNSYRATIVQALAGVALLVTIYLTWRRVAATEQQVVIAAEGQITERFTRAIEQLGSDKLEVRLGGIYALERIARDSEKDHWPIMEVLTAYVRENAPLLTKAEREKQQALILVATDIQAILTVIGRRRVEFERPAEQRLELSGTNLAGAKLRRANVSRANLAGARLYLADLLRADLSRANLSAVNLWGANLSGTNLSGADLSEADLPGALLIGADLSEASPLQANLRGANLYEANLARAYLVAADLSEAKGLTREQIESAITDEKTILPDYLKKKEEGPPQEAAGGEGES